mgnify:CR=1 FL=1
MDRPYPLDAGGACLFLRYFIHYAEPYEYPISQCCRFAVFVEVEGERSGAVVCGGCGKEVVRFVRVGQGESRNEEVFRQTRKEVRRGKDQLRELLRSQRFRACKLKDNFVGQEAGKEYGLVVEISSVQDERESVRAEKAVRGGEVLEELRSIVNDIFS